MSPEADPEVRIDEALAQAEGEAGARTLRIPVMDDGIQTRILWLTQPQTRGPTARDEAIRRRPLASS